MNGEEKQFFTDLVGTTNKKVDELNVKVEAVQKDVSEIKVDVAEVRTKVENHLDPEQPCSKVGVHEGALHPRVTGPMILKTLVAVVTIAGIVCGVLFGLGVL